ncbi:MAG: hypothetical protein AAGB34_06245 [Planctomycetota bacterium]
MSSYRGMNLFSAGPHEFVIGPTGLLLDPGQFGGSSVTGKPSVIGVTGLKITQHGWLVQTTSNAVWTQFDAIRAEADTNQSGTLVDETGRSWPTMTMTKLEALGPISRLIDGRWALEYEIQYREIDPGV